MNNATSQALSDCPICFMAAIKRRLVADFFSLKYCGNQTKKANKETSPQTPKDPRQPRLRSCAKGTLKPAAKAAPTAIMAEYKLVTSPDFLEKLRLVKLGNKTLPRAIAIPNIKVPI